MITDPNTAPVVFENAQWYLWLDEQANWETDTLYLPPVDLSVIDSNLPTCGWNELFDGRGKRISLPATIEEHFWGNNGNPHGMAGDYRGVSWFFTHWKPTEDLSGKHIFLHFASVRQRAEIYINEKLAGYDCIGNTPFRIDIGPFLKFGKPNRIAIRITDPGGNFTWRDGCMKWGNEIIPGGHGFGGITGPVTVEITDPVFISDVYIQNQPNPTQVAITVTLNHNYARSIQGTLRFDIIFQDEIIFREESLHTLEQPKTDIIEEIQINEARLWNPEHPHLYTLEVVWKDKAGNTHKIKKRFGFRWFEIREVDGDQQFYLNGKRIVLLSAISWGFFPINGMYATDSMAKQQIEMAKKFGLNMLNFHRAIGQEHILDWADELGLLFYEEPGNYRCRDQGDLAAGLIREKLRRMVIRDRSHPSLIINNLQNELGSAPSDLDHELLHMVHELDPSRHLTYSSPVFSDNVYGGQCPKEPAPIKTFMKPYDHNLYTQGWWDEHHAGSPGCYCAPMYRSVDTYRRYTNHKKEIVFYGEEGATGTPPRLERIKEELEKSNQLGWDGADYLDWYQAYDQFLTEQGCRDAFPTVDALTQSIGANSLYYQGKMIEHIRMNNIVDGYVINGWESQKLENHSGIVDCFRFPKADPSILSHYTQPVYLALKTNSRVIHGDTDVTMAVFIINERDLKGIHTLKLTAKRDNSVLFKLEEKVSVTGGTTYGELLRQDIRFAVPESNSNYYVQLHASLNQEGKQTAAGTNTIFVISHSLDGINSNAMVWDDSNRLQSLFKATGLGTPLPFDMNQLQGDYLLVGDVDVPSISVKHPLVEWIADGHPAVFLENTDKWAHFFEKAETIFYQGSRPLGSTWYGGSYFVKAHPLFEGLPTNTALGWEYWALIHYGNNRYGLRLKHATSIVGAVTDHKPEFLTAVGTFAIGRGTVILSTLDLLSNLENNVYNNNNTMPIRIILNYMKYASQLKHAFSE